MRNQLMALGVAGALGLAAIALTPPLADAAEHDQGPATMEGMGHGMPGMGQMQGMGQGTMPMMQCMMPMMMGVGGSAGMRMDARPAGDDGPASLAYQGANNKMHRDMAITYSGAPDVDFAKSMIPHHQGAIDTAKIVLAFGTDPEIKKLAEDIIKAQESEIAFLRDWLKKNGE